MKKWISMQTDNSVKKYIEAKNEFMRHCKLKNLSKETLEFYESTLGYFTKFLGTEDIAMSKLKKV